MTKEKQPSKYSGNELKYIKKVLKSENLSATGGNWNKVLEEKFARKFKATYAITSNSATSALNSCLVAAGVGMGDEVISPALTVVMNAMVTFHANAVPIFADIEADTFNIDPHDIERKITPKTKAIFIVGLYGLSPDMDPIMALAKKHNLTVIEDNAQNFLGLYKGRLTGTIGHMACYSFESSKHMSVGEGGITITNNKQLAERIRKCGGIGYKHLEAGEGRVKLNKDDFQDPNYKRHDSVGWNYRMPEVCAAIAVAQLERLDQIVRRRQQIAGYYKEAIRGCSWMIPQRVPKGYTSAYWSYAVKYEGEELLGVPWKKFYRKYREMGGDGFYAAWSIPYFEPVIANRAFCRKGTPYTEHNNKYLQGICPIAESIQPKMMQFKTNYRDLGLAKKKARALAKTIKYFETKI